MAAWPLPSPAQPPSYYFYLLTGAAVIVPSDTVTGPGATLTINKSLFSLCVGRAKKTTKKNGEEMGKGGRKRRRGRRDARSF